MEVIITGEDLGKKLTNITEYSSCQGDTCNDHDGCGEQCNHARCRY